MTAAEDFVALAKALDKLEAIVALAERGEPPGRDRIEFMLALVGDRRKAVQRRAAEACALLVSKN